MMRPTGPQRPAVLVVLLCLALMGIGRTTGSGWTMVVVSALLATLLVAFVWPPMILRRIRVGVEGPRDATAHLPLEMTLAVAGSGLVKLRTLSPASDWVSGEAPCRGVAIADAGVRGVRTEVSVEMRVGAPLGLVWWRRVDRVALQRQIDVGPMPVDMAVPPVVAGDIGDRHRPQRRSGLDSVRTIRDYVPGDAARLVHWGATARRDQLMVKELEDPEGALLAIVTDLRGPTAEAELAASRAAGLAIAALRVGIGVMLLTAEAGGPRVGAVMSPTEVSRRLARAVSGQPPDQPLPSTATVVRLGAGTVATR